MSGFFRPCHAFAGRMFAIVLLACLGPRTSAANPLFRTNDSVAFLGGSAVVSIDREGLLETLLTLAHPQHHLRFRTLAWEGDTVFSQPRELNFPRTPQLLRTSATTVACLAFGSLEALDRSVSPDAFRTAYRSLLDQLRPVCPRLVLVVPPPFESKPPPLPDFTEANQRLDRLAEIIRALAEEQHLPHIDLSLAFRGEPSPEAWSYDGRELTPLGHRKLAAAWARHLEHPALAHQALSPRFWQRPDIQPVLQTVRDKNRLWFDAWRPMNWAFLAGDRTEQQASRDHRDPSIRWFPMEMDQYPALIAEAETRIESLATQVRFEP